MNNCVVCNGKDPNCQYCNGTGIIVNTESDEQLMAILKSNERPKIVIIEAGEGAMIHFNGNHFTLAKLFFAGVKNLVKETDDKRLVMAMLLSLMNDDDDDSCGPASDDDSCGPASDSTQPRAGQDE